MDTSNKKTKNDFTANLSTSKEKNIVDSWLHISQQTECSTKQTGDHFFIQVTGQLNSSSPFETCNVIWSNSG